MTEESPRSMRVSDPSFLTQSPWCLDVYQRQARAERLVLPTAAFTLNLMTQDENPRKVRINVWYVQNLDGQPLLGSEHEYASIAPLIHITSHSRQVDPSSASPVSQMGRRGFKWTLPSLVSAPRYEEDEDGGPIKILDVCFHTVGPPCCEADRPDPLTHTHTHSLTHSPPIDPTLLVRLSGGFAAL